MGSYWDGPYEIFINVPKLKFQNKFWVELEGAKYQQWI